MKLKIRLLAMLWPVLSALSCVVAHAQVSASGVATPRALGIGDTIPEAVWQLPVQLVLPSGATKITSLSEWRGKLIILDFMGLWCGNCIKALPKLDSLQQTYNGQIQVVITTDDRVSQLNQFYARNAANNPLTLPAIAQDSVLRTYFPFKAVSHLVWITPTGVLATTTGTSYAQARYVQHILDGKTPDWLPKIDQLHFDYNRPLFASSGIPLANGNIRSNIPLYSVLTGPLQGVQPRAVTVSDSTTASTRRAFINMSLYQLILYSVGTHPLLLPDDRVVWAVEDPDLYRYKADSDTHKATWMLLHGYSYETVYRDNDAPHQWQQLLQADLRRYFPGLDFHLTNDTLYISDNPHTFQTY